LDEPIVGKRPLRIFIEHLEVRMRRRGVEVVVKLFDVFAVISLAVREAEKALFQNWIFPIPEGQSQTDALMVVTQAGNTVFAPTIGTAARLVVSEVIPGRPVCTVILAYRPPLTFAHVRAPAPPIYPPTVPLFQSVCFFH
jgi:hypothetical protein